MDLGGLSVGELKPEPHLSNFLKYQGLWALVSFAEMVWLESFPSSAVNEQVEFWMSTIQLSAAVVSYFCVLENHREKW